MRRTIPLNNGWKFNGSDVVIPHTLKQLPYNYFNISDATLSGRYEKKTVLLSQDIKGRKVILRFEGIGSCAKVFCNGQKAGENHGAYNRFECDITNLIVSGEEYSTAEIAVEVSAAEDPQTPPYGYKMDYLVFGGIYREASLLIVPQTHIARLAAFGKADGTIEIEAELSGDGLPILSVTDPAGQIVLRERLKSDHDDVEGEGGDCPSCNEEAHAHAASQKKGQPRKLHWSRRIDNPLLWDIGAGNLYAAHLEFGEDSIETRFGFRDASFKPDGFYINSRKVKLLGINRHQSYPVTGYAMPDTMQRLDAELIRRTGLNIVRTSHYMQDSSFLDRCDELGILVFEEIPGWQFVSSDKLWRERTVENVRSMIQRDKSHPSIVLWGVRINESQDDDELYSRTNALAAELDPLRQRGGVRFITHSHLLEDVYTFNDFIHRGDNEGLREPRKTHKEKCPHLVTEYCGHMYSTKPFDDEVHRLSHALRHAKVVNDMFADPRICGCIGWCLFDYNTHDNFGSGDMVCYHGICSQDRIPKLAWYLYASQSEAEPILAPSSFMDEGDFAANCMPRMAIFTNADKVRVSLDDEILGEYLPSRDIYPSLPHPPVIIESFLGERLRKAGVRREADRKLIQEAINAVKLDPSPAGYKRFRFRLLRIARRLGMRMSDFIAMISKLQDLAPTRKGVWKFEGIKEGKTVCQQIIDPDAPIVLQATPSQTSFKLSESNSYQVCQVQLTALREGCSMRLPYLFDSLQVEAAGAIELYGTKGLVTIVGGGGAIYLRTKSVGSGQLVIRSERFGEQILEFTVDR